MTKVCTKCGIEKDLEDFHKRNDVKDGHRSECKECGKIYQKQWKEDNKENVLLQQKEFSELNDMKVCIKCGIEKKLSEFNMRKDSKDGFYNYCKDCRKHAEEQRLKRKDEKDKEKICERKKQWREKNKKKIAFLNKQRYEKDKEKINIQHKQYRKNNKEKIAKQSKQYAKSRCNSDSVYKLRRNVSCVIRQTLKLQGSSKKGQSVLKYLPYSINDLRIHLESKFEPWMNWDNHGKLDHNNQTWQIDHIIPQSAFPYDSMEHPNFQKCWALENLQPLESFENLKKSNKIIDVDKVFDTLKNDNGNIDE